jgi:RNA polymerase-binding transcription factor DksA
VEAAIARIEGHTFGLCVRCGREISEKRLRAVPHAALCMDCIMESRAASAPRT